MSLKICGIPELVDAARPPVSHVLSLLDPAEPLPSALAAWPEEKRHLFRVDDIVQPLPGYLLPDEDFVAGLLATLRAIDRDTPDRLLIHCHAGRSRSTAAALMWLAQRESLGAEALADRLLAVRAIAWPNSLMLRLADEQLAAGGRLVEAGRLVRRATARAEPDFCAWLLGTHRKGEVEEALAGS
jgi:predicted protein tyrosine phosphatase